MPIEQVSSDNTISRAELTAELAKRIRQDYLRESRYIAISSMASILSFAGGLIAIITLFRNERLEGWLSNSLLEMLVALALGFAASLSSSIYRRRIERAEMQRLLEQLDAERSIEAKKEGEE